MLNFPVLLIFKISLCISCLPFQFFHFLGFRIPLPNFLLWKKYLNWFLFFWSKNLTDRLHMYTFSILLLWGILGYEWESQHRTFSYPAWSEILIAEYTEHLVNFLHSTPIFRNYHSLSLPNAVDGFLIGTMSRYIVRNNRLHILFRTRTFRALNVKTSLVRFIRIVVWGHLRLENIRFKASP